MNSGMNRRSFIKKSTAAVSGALMLSFYRSHAQNESNSEPEKLLDGLNPWMILSISADNQIVLTTYKHEMGQGTATGVATLFADELGADWDKMSVKMMSQDNEARSFSRNKNWATGTGGSSGLRNSWVPMREAGAAVRMMFLEAAANKWQVNSTECKIENSWVFGPNQQKETLGQLAEAAAAIDVPKQVKLKPESEQKWIGTSVHNLYQDQYVNGSMQYTMDLDLPNAVYASIERCPVYGGVLKSFNCEKTLQMPGIIDVIEVPSLGPTKEEDAVEGSWGASSRAGVAVIATTSWHAFEGRKALQIEWDFGANHGARIADILSEANHLKPNELKVLSERGQVDELFKDSESLLEAKYISHYQEHATMEPMVAAAHFENGKLEVWAPVQWATMTADAITQTVGIKNENILIHTQVAGGSFGRKNSRDFTNEVAYLSTKMTQPVKLIWSREDCTQNGHYHPYTYHHFKAAMKENTIAAVDLLSTHAAKWNLRSSFLYKTQAARLKTYQLNRLLENGAWRSVTRHRNTFATESFIDEIAHHVGADPLEYRLQSLIDPNQVRNEERRLVVKRQARVIENIREISNWDIPSKNDTAKGIAVGKFGNTYVAQVVSIHQENGIPVVDKVVCVADSGKVLNPQMAKGQLEGGIIWGLTALLYGGISLENGQVVQSSFHDYPILRQSQLPEIEIHLLESEGPIGGFGEPGVTPIAPAVLNAFFKLTGKRIRTIPFRWDEGVV